MSKQRMIRDEMWSDDWFFELDPSEKLLWVFLLTNPRNNVAGVFSCSINWICVHTGFDKQVVEMILSRFEKDGKIIRTKKWLRLINFAKHQSDSPKIALGIERILDGIDDEVKEELYPIHTISKGIETPVKYSKVKLSNKETKKPLHRTKKYLLNIPDEDIKEFTTRFEVTEKQVRSKGEDLDNWCDANGKRKTQYRKFLITALKKDYPERSEQDKNKPKLVAKLDDDGNPVIKNGAVVMVEK